MLVLIMLMSMLIPHASVDFSVLSFVLPCAYVYVTGEEKQLDVAIIG